MQVGFLSELSIRNTSSIETHTIPQNSVCDRALSISITVKFLSSKPLNLTIENAFDTKKAHDFVKPAAVHLFCTWVTSVTSFSTTNLVSKGPSAAPWYLFTATLRCTDLRELRLVTIPFPSIAHSSVGVATLRIYADARTTVFPCLAAMLSSPSSLQCSLHRVQSDLVLSSQINVLVERENPSNNSEHQTLFWCKESKNCCQPAFQLWQIST